MQLEFSKYFAINPEIRFGKPCVIGTRITVSDILIWLASGMSFEEITEDFPEITQKHIVAALSFASYWKFLYSNTEYAVKHGRTRIFFVRTGCDLSLFLWYLFETGILFIGAKTFNIFANSVFKNTFFCIFASYTANAIIYALLQSSLYVL